MSRVGTNTNSNDPQMVKSRVFVGNIDTRLTRDELEAVFGKYGSISALSLHKGYGFVQYTDEMSARAAVFGENTKQYYSKLLDCNVASEPKANRKRLPQQQPGIHSQPNSWESQSFSHSTNPYLAATAHALAVQAQSAAAAAVAAANSANIVGQTSAKRPRLQNMGDSSSARKTSNLVSLVSATPVHTQPVPRVPAPVLNRDVKDILICGHCKEIFENYDHLINHKSIGCRLRFICRCKQMGEPRSLTCIQCNVVFQSSWELVRHHVSEHGTSLFVGEDQMCPPPQADGSEETRQTKSEDDDKNSSINKAESKEKSNGEAEVPPGSPLQLDGDVEDELRSPGDEEVELKEVDFAAEEVSGDENEEVVDEPKEAFGDSPGELFEENFEGQEGNEPAKGSVDDESN